MTVSDDHETKLYSNRAARSISAASATRAHHRKIDPLVVHEQRGGGAHFLGRHRLDLPDQLLRD